MRQNCNPLQVSPFILSTFVFRSFTQTQFSFPGVPRFRASSSIPNLFLPVKANAIQRKHQWHSVAVNLWRDICYQTPLLSAFMAILDNETGTKLIQHNILRQRR